MRYIQLNAQSIKELQYIVKTDTRYKSRHRAQALLLSHQGKKTTEIASIFGYSQRTIYRWFDRFLESNPNALHDAQGRGRKPTLIHAKHGVSVKECIKKTQHQ